MATKTQTNKTELLQLQADIEASCKDCRHDIKNRMQNIIFENSDIKQTNTLLTERVANMGEDIKEIKQSVKEIANKFNTLDTKYATKEEHKENKELIKKLEDDNLNFKIMIARWLGGASVISVIIGFILNKIF